MSLVVGYYEWWMFCVYGFGFLGITVSFFLVSPLQRCPGLVRWVLVCMCFHYVFVGVLGVGLSMRVVLNLAPQVCGVLNI